MEIWMEDKKIWLFDLAHGNLDGDGIVKGFLKHYVLQGQGMGDVQRDMHFRTHYGDLYLKTAMSSLRAALEEQVGGSILDRLPNMLEDDEAKARIEAKRGCGV